MRHKPIYELTADDLERAAVWVFPMDESVDDETWVRAVQPGELVPSGLQIVARARFFDQRGQSFPGYLYPGCGDGVESTRPVMWIDGLCLTFWNGMFHPNAQFISDIQQARLSWPLSFQTTAAGLPPQNGILRGVYYLDFDNGQIRCVTVN